MGYCRRELTVPKSAFSFYPKVQSHLKSAYICLDGQRCDWCNGYLGDGTYVGSDVILLEQKYYILGLFCSRRCVNQAHADDYRGNGRLVHVEGNSDCFITTAVCSTLNKGDDCAELTSFRQFRDGWLTNDDGGQVLIQEYYQIAPQIVRAIDAKDNASVIYTEIWEEYLSPALTALQAADNQSTKDIYVEMVRTLQAEYLR